MKVLIIFVICIVAVLAIDDCSNIKEVNDMLKEAGELCRKEMNLDSRLFTTGLSAPKIETDYARIEQEACYQACLDKKMGVLSDDGTYDLERIVSYANTPDMKKKVERIYSTKIQECVSAVGKSKTDCKMAACLHRMQKSYYTKEKEI